MADHVRHEIQDIYFREIQRGLQNQTADSQSSNNLLLFWFFLSLVLFLENFNLLIVEIHERLYYWLEKGIGIKSLRFLIQHVFDDLDYLEPESYRFCELVRNLLVNQVGEEEEHLEVVFDYCLELNSLYNEIFSDIQSLLKSLALLLGLSEEFL